MKTLVIGAAVVDEMLMVERLPQRGEDILCTETKTVIGGCAFNVASTMRNMGALHDLFVPVGKGTHADLIRKGLAEKGYSPMVEDMAEDNGYCLSLVEKDGERTFITIRGLESRFQEKWFEGIDINAYDRVYVAGYQVCGESGKIISDWLSGWHQKVEQAPTIFFAPGPVITSISEEIMKSFFSLHPILHINEKEAIDYTQKSDVADAAKTLYDQTQNVVLITLGSKGTFIYNGEGGKVIPAQKTDVIDTVGAGDSHIGAVISGLSAGQSLDEAVNKANQVAALIVGVQGPTMDRETFNQKMGL